MRDTSQNFLPLLLSFDGNAMLVRLKNIISLLLFCLLYFMFPQRKIVRNRNLLFVNHGFLGELILCTTLFENENKFKNSHEVYFLINESYRELFSHYKGRIKLLYVHTEQYRQNLFYRIKFIRFLRQFEFYQCYNLNIKNGLRIRDEIALLSGATQIFTLKDTYKNSIKPIGNTFITNLYTRVLHYNTENEFYKRTLLIEEVIGNKISFSTLLPIDEATIEHTKQKLGELPFYDRSLPLIVISPISGHKTYDWPVENYRKLIDEVSKTFKVNILILISKDQLKDVTPLFSLCKKGVYLISNAFSLSEKIALVHLSTLFIGNDSGLTHVAKAFKKKFIGVIGGAFFGRYFPYEPKNNEYYMYHKMDCFGCEMKCIYKEPFCSTNVQPQDIITLVERILSDEHKNI